MAIYTLAGDIAAGENTLLEMGTFESYVSTDIDGDHFLWKALMRRMC
jgi:hypothetical protein